MRPRRYRRQRDVAGSVGSATAAAAGGTASAAAPQHGGQPASEDAVGGEVDDERGRVAAVEDDEQQTLRHVRLQSDGRRRTSSQHDGQLVNVRRQTERQERQRRTQLRDRRRPDVLTLRVDHDDLRLCTGLVRPPRRTNKTDQRYDTGGCDDDHRKCDVDHEFNAADHLSNSVTQTDVVTRA